MDNIMIVIFFEIPKVDFCHKLYHHFKRHVVQLKEVIVLEYLERQELKRIIWKSAIKEECIELDSLKFLRSVVVEFSLEVLLPNHLEEFHFEGIDVGVWLFCDL